MYYQLAVLVLYTEDASFDPNQHQQSDHLDGKGEKNRHEQVYLMYSRVVIKMKLKGTMTLLA